MMEGRGVGACHEIVAASNSIEYLPQCGLDYYYHLKLPVLDSGVAYLRI